MNLRSPWVQSGISIVLYLVTMAALFTVKGPSVFHPIEIKAEDIDVGEEYHYWSFRTYEIQNLIDSLRREREAVVERRAELDAREARIMAESEELQRLRREIEAYRKELSHFLVEVRDTELQNLRSEVAIYNNMEAASIVEIFTEKPDDEVVKLLALMKPDQVAPILDQMMAQAKADEPRAERVARLLRRLQRFRIVSGNGS